MNSLRSRRFHRVLARLWLAACLLAAGLAPAAARACAACYARSDSPLANAMNWGIFTLLGVVVTVLAVIAGFFIHLIRREAARARDEAAESGLSEVKI